MQVHTLLKRRIERKAYSSKEEMQEMLDAYYFVGRILLNNTKN